MINISTRNLFIRAGFDASGMSSGTRQANNALRQFGQNVNKQMSSLSNTISSSMGKIGKLLAGAFAVKAIVNFGKECTQLGSDLEEEQNVVDVTFGNMAESINEFARTSVENFGLSETAAKKYAGVFGSMSLSMGLTRQQALEMSKSVVALTGDVASFFNLSNDVAYTKLKSIWTGETETLKDLGVVMTQANLKQFALSQGIGKSIDKMTEAEKVMLRYEYVTKALSNTQGDFARNIDSWANQIRVLSEQFNAFKATIGQGLIVALTPVVKGLNLLIGKLRIAAGYFKAFMELLFGKQSVSEGAGMADIADSTESIADSASGASDAVEGVGDAAKKAGKKAKNAIMGFDEVNQLSKSSDSKSGSGGGSGLDNMGGAVEFNLGETVEQTDKLTTMFDGVIAQLTKMKELFSSGFKIGFETANLDALNSAIANIKTGFMNLFNDGTILNSFINMLDNLAFNLGAISGSFGSVGVTLTSNLIGGVANYLNENSQYIKDRIISIFDVIGEISTISENFSVAFAEIFSVFGGENAQQITANIIGMFSNGFLGAVEVALKLGRDVISAFTTPITENKELIKSTLEETLKPIESITGSIKDFVTNTFITINQVYDTYVAPAFQNITTALTNLMTNILNNYNTYILPVINGIASKVGELFTAYIQPNVDLIITSIGRVIEAGSKILNEVIEPMIEDLNNLLAPAIGFVVEKVSDFAIKLTGKLFKALGYVADKIADVCDWLSEHKLAAEIIITTLGSLATAIGIVTVAMNLGAIAQGLITTATTLWNVAAGIGATVTGAFGAAMAILTSPITLVVLAITAVIAAVVLLIRHWDDVKVIAAKCWDSIKDAWNKAGEWFDTTVVQPVAKFFNELWDGIKQAASNAWTNICNAWQSAGEWFGTNIIEPIKSKFTEWKTDISNLGAEAWSGVKTGWNNATQWFDTTIITPITKAFSTLWGGIKSSAKTAFDSVGTSAKNGMNWVIDHINNMVGKINSKLSFNLPEFFGGGKVGFSIPKIPKLAKGGIIDNPTIAMVGEAGREAVVPLENNTGWTNEVASLLANALMPFMGVGNNGNSGQNVSLEMDGTTFARTATPYVIKEMKRLGFV